MMRSHGFWFALGAVLFLSGCAAGIVSVPESTPPTGPPAPSSLDHQVIVVVHGDASYTYHDTTGTRRAADEKVLREAFAAARSTPHAEAFVFHQRSQRSFLGLFPRDDGTAYHFAGGRLLATQTYRRSSGWDAEVAYVRSHTRTSTPERRVVAYYGHAVPETPAPYHRSHPADSLSVDVLARALASLGGADVTVLSTCDGGTPHTVATLAPETRYLVAAPGDLHLSMIDGDLLPILLQDAPAPAAVDAFVQRAFSRLTSRTVTETVLARYDTHAAAPLARDLDARLRSATGTEPAVDCASLTRIPTDSTGVRVWLRAPKFGPNARRSTHSGWACAAPDDYE